MTMASVKKSVLMEYLQCTLCMEDMQRSCILQCHHSFCIDCLQKYIAQATDPQKMTCPICRKVTTLPDGDLSNLPPNFFMDNLKELITKETDGDEDEMKVMASADREMVTCSLEDCQGEATMYCTICQEYLCQTCNDEHAGHRLTKKHKTIRAEEVKSKVTSSTESHHPCGRHPSHILDMYCKTCDEIICHECINTDHSDHHITSLRPFVKPCEERLDTLLKKIDKLLKYVNLARATSQQQVDNAQHHLVSLKAQVTSTFQQIRKKLAQQEKRLMSSLKKAAARVDKVASATQDQQQLIEVNLESLRFLGQSLLTGDVYDQMNNLPSLEEAVEKRWKTDIPGVAWKDQSDQDEKINMSDVDHLTLTETSHTTSVLQRLEEGAVNVTGAVCDKPDQQTSAAKEDGEITRLTVHGGVYGICLYNNTIFTAMYNDRTLYMYSSSKGVLIKKQVINKMKKPWDITLMTHHKGAKLIITDCYANCLHVVPVKTVGDKCELGAVSSQKLNYTPYGVCVNYQKNLVVADQSGKCLHVYNNSVQNISTVRLPSDVCPMYLSADPSGGCVISDRAYGRITWVDEDGKEKQHYQDTTFGPTVSLMRGIVRAMDNRYIVADYGKDKLFLCSRDGGNVRCLIKDKIINPYGLFLDQKQNKLYVGTYDYQVVIYDYYMLLGEKHPVKYIINTLSIKKTREHTFQIRHYTLI